MNLILSALKGKLIFITLSGNETEKEKNRMSWGNKEIQENGLKSPTSVTDKIFSSSKSILGKVLSPTKEKFRDKVMQF